MSDSREMPCNQTNITESYNTDISSAPWLCLRSEAAQMGITLTDEQMEQFAHFYVDLVEKNKVMNLTAITDLEGVIAKHFLDSLCLAKVYEPKASDHILDMGTGGGFPGIPLKIAYPETHFVLADSLNKRIKFLQDIIDKYRFKNIDAIHCRAEELARKSEHRQQYDVVVSRAVANLSTLCEYCLPYVKIGGVFVSYKSGDIDEELERAKNAVKILGGKCCEVKRFGLDDAQRSLVVIRKVKDTPGKYPRKAGMPGKEPLH